MSVGEAPHVVFVCIQACFSASTPDNPKGSQYSVAPIVVGRHLQWPGVCLELEVRSIEV